MDSWRFVRFTIVNTLRYIWGSEIVFVCRWYTRSGCLDARDTSPENLPRILEDSFVGCSALAASDRPSPPSPPCELNPVNFIQPTSSRKLHPVNFIQQKPVGLNSWARENYSTWTLINKTFCQNGFSVRRNSPGVSSSDSVSTSQTLC